MGLFAVRRQTGASKSLLIRHAALPPPRAWERSFVFVSFRRLAALLPLVALSACATALETSPARTATEQLLVSHAAERAASQFSLALPKGAKVFLDTTYFRGEGSDYAASTIREALISRGSTLVPTRDASDVVVEIRLGALSIDNMQRIVGIPRLTLPISETFTVVTIPELSIYSRRDRTGVAEFSAFAYDTRTGAPLALGARVAGAAKIRSHTLMMVLPLGQQEVRPGDPAVESDDWWKVWRR